MECGMFDDGSKKQDAMDSESEIAKASKLREKLERYPDAFRDLVLAYREKPDPGALDRIVVGLVEFHQGDAFKRKLEEKGDAMLLVEEAGLDSLTFIDISFDAEDLFGVVVELQDMSGVRTLRDLKELLRKRITAPTS
jgi:acyl carrier protein